MVDGSATRRTRRRLPFVVATVLGIVASSISGAVAVAAPGPDTIIDTGPATFTALSSATFTFHSTKTPATFSCKLDALAYSSCASPVSYSGLAVGAHSFHVYATWKGTPDPSPAAASWTIDVTKPSVPTNLAATAASSTSVTLSWTAATDNIAIAGYDVFRDGTLLTPTGSVTTYTDATVTAGSTYTYTIDARDAAGNASAQTSGVSITVPIPPETVIDSGPPTGTTSTSASFTFHSTPAGATFTCKLDAGAAGACTSPMSYTGLTQAVHTFTVFATLAGISDPTPATATWTVSSVVGGSGPAILDANAVNSSRIELVWTAVASASGYTVWRDGVVLTSGSMLSAIDSAIAPGSTHVYNVTATVGGVETSPSPNASVVVPNLIDTQAPASPSNLAVTATASDSVTLSFSAATDDVGVIGYFVKINGVLYAYTEGSLSAIVHNLKAATTYGLDVFALDAAGHYSTPAHISATTAALGTSDTTAPAGPSLTATPYSASEIDLSWSKPSDVDLAGFLVFQGSQQIADIPANTTVQTRVLPVPGLATSTAYTFSIRAYDTAGNQSAAASRGATTLAATDVRIALGPIVQRVSATSARIVWRTNVAAAGSLTYSTPSGNVTVQDPTPSTDHDILIGPLPSLSNITYTLNYAASISGSLRTCSSSLTTFKLDVVGDMGGGSSAETSIANLIAADNADLIASLGDTVYPTGADKDFPAKLLTPYATAIRNSGFFTAFGNHEYYDPGAAATHRIFSQPGNESYFSFDCSGVHISVVDPYQPYAPGTAQYQWLANDLATTTQPWKVVVLHVPPYSSSVAGVAPGSTGVLDTLYEQYGVSLVVAGHSHNYERSNVINGVTYVVDGGGGNGLNTFSGTAPSWSAYRAAEFSYLRLAISSTGMAGTEVRQDGSVGDSFTIAAYVPGPPDTVIDSAPTGRTGATSATISFHSSPTGSTFTCALDAAAPSGCASPVTFTGLSDGLHTVSVTATNAYGSDATPATASWTVDSSPPIFSDGFESGDLSGWSSAGGLVVETSDVRSGAFAAGGTTTNGGVFAKKTLPTQLADAYMRVAFKLNSQSGQVNMLRVRTAAGASIGYVYLSPSGLVGFHNDVAASGTLSAFAPGAGWHALELHVGINGAASIVEAWLDGTLISAVSATTDLGTTPVGIFQIGESGTGQTYNVVFDDAAVATARLGPAGDNGLPTVPTGLIATVQSAFSVALVWGASTDDLGIGGYDVYRDGVILASLGNSTTFSDTTVLASTTYSYTVRARDTSGNASAQSGPTSVTTPAAPVPVFADGFESGGTSAWTSVGGLTVEGTIVHSGAFAAEGNTLATAAAPIFVRESLASTYPDSYARVAFNLASFSSSQVTLVRLRAGTGGAAIGGSIGFVYATSTGKLFFKADALGATAYQLSGALTGGWHVLELHIGLNGTSSVAEVWLDGSALTGIPATLDLSAAPTTVGQIQAGDTVNVNADLILDDTAFGTARLGPFADGPPTVPANLAATPTSPYAVSLTWDASTDDLSVAGYDIFRDGSLFGSVGAVTSYNDSTVQAATSHGYQVRARDSSGNLSALTAIAGATTPADAAPSVPTGVTATAPTPSAVQVTWISSTDDVDVPTYDVYRDGLLLVSLGNVNSYSDVTVLANTSYSYAVLARDLHGNSSALSDPAPVTVPGGTAPVFSDSFESGGLSAWTSSGGLGVENSNTHSGTYAAEGNTTNGATYAKKLLPSTYASGYLRAYIYIASAASQVNVLRFRTAADGSIGYLYVTAAGVLGLRNDAGAQTLNSSTTFSFGAWHSLELHFAIGPSGGSEVWLDGVLVTSLSATMNLGTTNIGKVQIGEVNTGRTYDVIFDDVVFNTTRVGS